MGFVVVVVFVVIILSGVVDKNLGKEQGWEVGKYGACLGLQLS